MKDDTQETGSRRGYFRYAVFSLAALLVLSLGFVFIPGEPPVPAPPGFSEQARASALADALSLRETGIRLGAAAGETLSGPQPGVRERVVRLLTVQARALMPAAGAPAGPSAPAAPQPAAPPSAAGFAAALQASAAKRLKDAEAADGGIARLLAGAGTAQLLAAEDLAQAAGIPLQVLPGAGIASTAAPGNREEPTAGSFTAPAVGCAGPPADGMAGMRPALGPALAAAVAAERELVYAYQAALTRLGDASAVPASRFLAQHVALGAEATERGQENCAGMAPKPAGYALNRQFLAAPAAALGALEAGTLPVYGDLVALSEGAERDWALAALQSAARRTVHWGGSAGPVPGMVLAEPELPQLPGQTPSPGSSSTSPRG